MPQIPTTCLQLKTRFDHLVSRLVLSTAFLLTKVMDSSVMSGLVSQYCHPSAPRNPDQGSDQMSWCLSICPATAMCWLALLSINMLTYVHLSRRRDTSSSWWSWTWLKPYVKGECTQTACMAAMRSWLESSISRQLKKEQNISLTPPVHCTLTPCFL